MSRVCYDNHSDNDWNGWCEIRDVRLWRDGNQVRTTALYQWNVENTSGDDENWSVEYKHVLTAYNDSTREHTIDDWHATRPNVFTDPVEQNSFTCEDGGFLGHGDISFHNRHLSKIALCRYGGFSD